MSDLAPRADLVLRNTPRRMHATVLARLQEAKHGDEKARRLKPQLDVILGEIDRHDRLMAVKPFTWKARAQVEGCRRHLLQLREAINADAARKQRGRPRKASAKEELALRYSEIHAQYPRRDPRWIVEDALSRSNSTNTYDAVLEGVHALIARGEGSQKLVDAKHHILNQRRVIAEF